MSTDTQDMVERVGHAVCHFRRKCPGKPCSECLERARAALEAMREPTEEMVTAASRLVNSDNNKIGGNKYRARKKRYWSAMITAALQPKGDG